MIDLLTTCGTFNPNDCTSSEDLCKLLDKKSSWEIWITFQIAQDSVESYKEWHDRMSIRCDLPPELTEAYDKLFGEKNERE